MKKSRDAIKKKHEDTRQKNIEHRKEIKRLNADKENLLHGNENLLDNYEDEKKANLEKEEVMEQLKTKLKKAEIAGDPQKIKDLEDEHNTKIINLEKKHREEMARTRRKHADDMAIADEGRADDWKLTKSSDQQYRTQLAITTN